MYFSKEATETVISPTDTVFSNADAYDSWWQIANCATGEGELRLYRSNGITRFSVPLVMRNQLWYVEQDISSMLYRAKMTTESEAFVHAVTGSTLHNLWYHRLCHRGKFCTENIDKVTDCVPSLRTRNLFFSCHDCNAGKVTAKIK